MSDGVIDRSSTRFIQVPNHLVLGIKNGNALLVYSVLKTYTNQGVKLVYPKRETIARNMGAKTTKPVDAALKVLHDLGLVASFHRFKNDENKISYTKSDEFNQQTSNGYIVYDVIHVPGPGWDDPNSDYMPPAYPAGVPNGNVPGVQTATPPGVQMEAPRVAESGHEVYPLEVQPDEVDKTPLAPQGADGASAAEGDPAMARFQEFYDVYDRKKKRPDAERAWKKAVKKADPQVIIDAAVVFIESQKVRNKHPQYTPFPATWLNGEQWNDEIDTPTTSPQSGLAAWGAPSTQQQQPSGQNPFRSIYDEMRAING